MKKILVLALALLTTACSSPRPNFFQPVAVQSVEQSYPQVKSTILLHQILLPAEITRPQMTTLGTEDYEVRIDEFNRWGASPERLVQHVLNKNISLALPNAMVENKTPLQKNYQYAVAIEISEMTGRLDDYAELQASYFIKNKSGRTLKSGKFTDKMKIDGGYDEYVLAQSTLLGQLATQISSDIAKLK